jgi:DNA-binding response OmpR family regulator
VTAATDSSMLPTLLVHLERERARALVRSAFPRRRWKIISTRSAEEVESVFRRVLVDAALIDLGAPDDDTW